MNTSYDQKFFAQMDKWAAESAAVIAPLVFELLKPHSLLDVGGGTGAWTAAFAAAGVNDFLCVDGDYVNRAELRIPGNCFQALDLTQPIDLARKFDLAICLEVAEHLPESSAEILVQTLVSHSDAILFSAAIPHQGGTSHINEQWPEYWAQRFLKSGYRCFDCVRWPIWHDQRVAWWYKQNTLLYLSSAAISSLGLNAGILNSEVISPPAVVHPDVYLSAVSALRNLNTLTDVPRLPWAVRAFAKSAQASIRFHAGRVVGRTR